MWRGDPPFRFMKEEKRPELLSPAGDFDTLLAVINAGADAVYLGMQRFGARAYAKNFTRDQIIEGLSYAHLNHAKIYLTVNTLYKEEELPELLEELLPLYEAGLDAVIVQDFGAFSLMRKSFPKLHLHASTQMAVTGADGARLLKKMGAERVVLARELGLEELRHITEETDVELECFIHGALCYGYSGLCLMSSMLGGRSGNRGRCAGTCRLPFSVNGGEPCYPLSLKDLCTIELIPELVSIGIRSFKIEGRMKSPEYAAGVTSIYRKYLDRYLSDPSGDYHVEKEDLRALLDLGNRSGFTTGYYDRRNDPEMVTVSSPSHSHVSDGELHARYGHFIEKRQISVTGNAVFKHSCPISLTVTSEGVSVTAEGAVPSEAKNRPMTEENIREKLLKTGDTYFSFQELSVELEDGLFLPVKELNELRRSALDQFLEKLIGKDRRRDAVVSVMSGRERRTRKEAPTVTVHTMNRELLDTILSDHTVDTVILEGTNYPRGSFVRELSLDISCCRKAGKKVRFALPHVMRMETAKFYESIWPELMELAPEELLIRTPDEIGFLQRNPFDTDRVVLDERLYAWSGAAAKAFEDLGFNRFTLPLELSKRELLTLSSENTEMIVYGRIPLMITANCVRKDFMRCDHGNAVMKLTDRFHKDFPVKMVCGECYNLIYNPDIYMISGDEGDICEIAPASIRYAFTFETPEETARILKGIKNTNAVYTRGYFRRGIE